MDGRTEFTVSIAGMGIRFEFPFPMDVPQELRPFVIPADVADVVYRAEIHETFRPRGEPVAELLRQTVYQSEEGWLRVYDSETALLLRPTGEHTLFLAPESAQKFQHGCSISGLLGAEYVFAMHRRVLLHSSAIRWGGKAILFCGPSGIGKSTQAELWHRYAGADIINGDRCVVTQTEEGFLADGSPFCGSSGIRTRLRAPIGAVVFLEQGEENELRGVSCREAYRRLYSQIIANPWDSVYTDRVCAILEGMMAGCNMFYYRCRPDETAVEDLRRALCERQIISKE